MTPEQQAQLEALLPMFQLLRSVKEPVSAAPTYVPRNLVEQVVLYSSGGTYRVYFWIDAAAGWHYVALT